MRDLKREIDAKRDFNREIDASWDKYVANLRWREGTALGVYDVKDPMLQFPSFWLDMFQESTCGDSDWSRCGFQYTGEKQVGCGDHTNTTHGFGT